MRARLRALLANRPHLLELFIFTNLGFLAVDIYSAHMVNSFAHWAEWVPFVFSLLSPFMLLPVVWRGDPCGPWARPVGLVVGALSILVGVAGLFYHLESQFFLDMTMASLVYTAPFVAPLAYTGLGFLLLLNRLEDQATSEWSLWVIVLAAGGFLGNFILSVCDHAQNGFFRWEEWIPVVTSAFAISFLFVFCARYRDRSFAVVCIWIMVLQILIGLLGFAYHFNANLSGTAVTMRDKFIFGAPIFAPLLFANLALLAILGIVDTMFKTSEVNGAA